MEFLGQQGVIAGLKAGSKKQVLQELAHCASELTELDEREILNVLLEREKLGTTGIGHGIAIPHGRLEALDHVVGIFARLSKPVDFESIDEEPVDLIFALLAPDNGSAEHLKALAKVSRTLRDKARCEKLRGANGPDAIYALLNETSQAA